MAQSQPMIRRVLYFAGKPALVEPFLRALGEVSECKLRRAADHPTITCSEAAYSFVVCTEVAAAMDALHREFFNLVLLDLRESMTVRRRKAAAYERGLTLLEAMDQEPDIERRYGFHRILVLVAGPDAAEVDRQIATLGARGVGRVMRDLSVCNLNPSCKLLPSAGEFARTVLAEMKQLTVGRPYGHTALCASGGGITGLYFELGALKCMEDCLPPGALNEFDLYFGISAGSVLVGMLANGFTVSEFMAAIAGHTGGRIPPLDLNLLDSSHLDLRGLTAPLRQLLLLLAKGAGELVRGRFPFSLESLVFEYGDLFHAPFNTEGFGELLRKSFTRPGMTDDFRKLRRRLYIGATDQDKKEHVLFGKPPHHEVPISRAICASMSLNPVFAPTEIDGRFYEDGAVTRTSNFGDAIRKGADLILTIDPIVPYVSKRPGFARSHGIFYNTDQDIRTVSFTRYDTTRNFAVRRHPEVSLYTFLPANNLRRVLSINPMNHRPYLEIWRGAYLGTLKRIQALGYRMQGDFAAHGVVFDPAPAVAVGARLEAARQPTFSDFFVNGKVELYQPETPPPAGDRKESAA